MSARKINLDTTIYNLLTGKSYFHADPSFKEIQERCDHDYPEQPNEDKDEYACWICTKCSLRRCYEVWD